MPQDVGILDFETRTTSTGRERLAVSRIKPGFCVAGGRVGELVWDELDNPVDFIGLEADEMDGPVLCYADVWDMDRSAASLPRLVDAAYLGARTSNASQRVVQIKTMPVRIDELDDAAYRDAFYNHDIRLPRFGVMRLISVELTDPVDSQDPCDPCATDFNDEAINIGNHLFRVEVHDSDLAQPHMTADGKVFPHDGADSPSIILKWSRDNGGLDFERSSSAVDDLRTDARYQTALFELTSLRGDQRQGSKLRGDERHSRLVDHDGLLAALDADEDFAFIRIWDGAAEFSFDGPNSVTVNPVANSGAVAELSNSPDPGVLMVKTAGFALKFAGLSIEEETEVRGFVFPGDAWVVEIREFAAGTPEEPQLIWKQEPVAVHHDYLFIGLSDEGKFLFDDSTDIRDRNFPPLTDLEARDVFFDNVRVGTDAANVQEAIEDLYFRNSGGCGEIPVPPGVNLADFLDSLWATGVIANGSDLKICLGARTHLLDRPVRFQNLGHVTITGTGDGSTVRIRVGDFGMQFIGCSKVSLRDFKITRSDDLVLCLNIEKCKTVSMQDMHIATTGSPKQFKQHSVRIFDSKNASSIQPDVTIEKCRFMAAPHSSALLIVDPRRLVVRDNIFTGTNQNFDLKSFLEHSNGKQILARTLMDKIAMFDRKIGNETFNTLAENGHTRRIRVNIGQEVWAKNETQFLTDYDFDDVDFWLKIFRSNRTSGSNYYSYTRSFRKALASWLTGDGDSSVSLDSVARARLTQFGEKIGRMVPKSAADSAISVAFNSSPEITLENDFTGGPDLATPVLAQSDNMNSVLVTGNYIEGYARGISVGASKKGQAVIYDEEEFPRMVSGFFSYCGHVTISDNHIRLSLPVYLSGRFGVFVGNAITATILHNRIENRYATELEPRTVRWQNSDVKAGNFSKVTLGMQDVPDSQGVRLWGNYAQHVDVSGNSLYGLRTGIQFKELNLAVAQNGSVSTPIKNVSFERNSYFGPGEALMNLT
ncbi:hypothetical protein [Hoeflea ulvae]|uniref:Right handed beta helix domain-containing protein n=1 Tax=Hoeflea ulvae TaxID=2983764 RepID=A0ABT3YL10_9HYPH|nr:hypothetical protein [Hoeflea ulvae]MCY0096591.1 hypothetical protein [Hoeflea ulvae]